MRGSNSQGAYLVKNFHVHDNVITQTTGTAAGIRSDLGDSIFTSWNNRYENNEYRLLEDGWKGYGSDLNGA